MCHVKMARMRVREISATRVRQLRGQRSREVIAHDLRKRGHGTDAKAIWRYETGRSQPHSRLLPDYAEVLGARSVDELYADDDEEAAPMGDHHAMLAALAVALEPFHPRKVKAART